MIPEGAHTVRAGADDGRRGDSPVQNAAPGDAAGKKVAQIRRWLAPAAIFIISLGVIVFRDPSLFYSPRFWAEDFLVYFHSAYVSPLRALIEPHQGYYVLWSNLSGILEATIIPLEYAPAISEAMALLVVLLIIIAILVNQSPALDSPVKKALACWAALVVGAAGEIWLTAGNSPAVFPVLVFLILIDEKQNPAKRRLWYALAFIAGLSGPQSNFIAPLFLLRYWLKRERGDLVIFFILLFTSIVEFYSIVYSGLVLGDKAYIFPSIQKRFELGNVRPLSVLSKIFGYFLEYPFVEQGGVPGKLAGAMLIVGCLLARNTIRDWIIFPLAAGAIIVVAIPSSLDMQGGARYVYAPSVILAMLLIALSLDYRVATAGRVIAGLLLGVCLLHWSWTFRSSLGHYHDPDWPSWSSEVQAWRADPSRRLQVWPIWSDQTARGVRWSMQLPPQGASR
jgi:hypothetical protein